MVHIPPPLENATPTLSETTARGLKARSAAWRAMAAVDLVEGRTNLDVVTLAQAAVLLRVGVASVRAVRRASPRDRLALVAGAASIRSIRQSSAPIRPQPTLTDMWHAAPDIDRLALLRSLDPDLLADLVAVRPATI
jgi:hypothetical protein